MMTSWFVAAVTFTTAISRSFYSQQVTLHDFVHQPNFPNADHCAHSGCETALLSTAIIHTRSYLHLFYFTLTHGQCRWAKSDPWTGRSSSRTLSMVIQLRPVFAYSAFESVQRWAFTISCGKLFQTLTTLYEK
jgi:hypothetical protein